MRIRASRRDALIGCAHVHGMHTPKYLFTAREGLVMMSKKECFNIQVNMAV